MTQDQWERAKAITADALDRHPDCRAAFVETATSGDDEVREEVLRLLSANEPSRNDFLSSPCFDVHEYFERPLTWSSRLKPGQQLAGRFQIDRFLGSGGMGQVYAATDLELHEPVALKTINPAIAFSPDAIDRFKREVKKSRRITHRCVCRVYDLFSHEQPDDDTIWFLTMELLEGETLREAIARRNQVPARTAITLVSDIVEALAAAHAMNIVHGDLKPGNVMLVEEPTGRQRAVVMDFGLARDIHTDIAGDLSGDGTPAYMAPEQVSGGNPGFEADQYALGLLICELFTGSRPMLGTANKRQAQQQLCAWFRKHRRHLRRPTRRAIRRCLAFSAKRRLHHVRDILPVITGARRQVMYRLASSAVLVGFFALVGWVVFVSGSTPQVENAVRLTPESGLSSAPDISRNGKWIVYSSNRAQSGNLDIWIQAASGGSPRRLTTDPASDEEPRVSPDGKLVAFRSERNGGGLYVIHSDGSGETLVAPGGRTPAFSPDGRSIAYWEGLRDDVVPDARLYVIPSGGGRPQRLAADFADARYPVWDSSGQFLLFDGCKTKTSALSTCTEWWVMRKDGQNVTNTGAVALLGAQRIDLSTPPFKAWHGDQIVFSGSRDNFIGLWTLKIAPVMRVTGIPRPITAGDSREREPSVAESGAIVFGRITAALHIWRIALKGGSAPSAITDEPELEGCPTVSADGRWAYFTRKIHGIYQLFSKDLISNRESMVFTSAENKFWPLVSPDGKRIVFEVRTARNASIWLIEQGGPPHKLCSGCSHPTSWFGADDAVFYASAAGEIKLLDVHSGASNTVLSSKSGAALGGADWNPVNEYLLFTVQRAGTPRQVFAIEFPRHSRFASGRWVPLTADIAGASLPRWAVDGDSFYFLSRDDGFRCIWGRKFSRQLGVSQPPFPIMHYHDLGFAPDRTSPLILGMSVSSDALFLNVGDVSDTVWLGQLSGAPLQRMIGKLFIWP